MTALENFAVTLEKLKLPKTANAFLQEIEQKNNIRIDKTIASNPLVSIIMEKLEAPKLQNKKSFKFKIKFINVGN